MNNYNIHVGYILSPGACDLHMQNSLKLSEGTKLLQFVNLHFPQPSPINSLSHSDPHNQRDSQLPAGFQKANERITSTSGTNKV